MSTSHVRIQLHPALWFVPDDCILIRNDEPIALTARETKLLRLLLETPGYLGASFLYQRLFRRKAYKSEPALREHCIEQIVSKLRRKLGEEPWNPHILIGKRGMGYKLTRYDPPQSLDGTKS